MEYRNIYSKIFLSLLVVGSAVFLGVDIARTVIAYDLFLPGALVRKPFLTDAQVNYSIRIYAVVSFYSLLGYCSTLIGAIGSVIMRRGSFRRDGWVLMSAALFISCIPIELYSAFLDVQLLRAINDYSFDRLLNGKELQTLFFERFSSRLSSAGFLAHLAYITALLFMVWRPLTKRTEITVKPNCE